MIKVTIEEKGIEDGLSFFNKPISDKQSLEALRKRALDKRNHENTKKAEVAESLKLPTGNKNVL